MPVLTTLGAATAKAWGFLQQVAAAADPYFNYVTMLLTGNGTNGAQNNTFLDSSSNAFSITRNGNTTQGSFSPYGSLWSTYYNSSSNYVTFPNITGYQLGTGDFCVEGWVNLASAGNNQNIIACFGASGTGNGWTIYRNGTHLEVYAGAGGNAFVLTGTSVVGAGTWTHFAFVRNGSTCSLYVNGTSEASTTNSSFTNETTNALYIARRADNTSEALTGYVSNLRIVKGSPVYTANFTPSTTPLTAITNTTFLFNSNRFIDTSSNNATATVNGTPSVQRFSPFNPTASYDTATIGGSGYFDGTGDYLTAGAESNWTFLNNGSDWTVEFFVYTGDVTTEASILSTAVASANIGLDIAIYNSNIVVTFYRGSSGSFAAFTSSGTVKTNQWNYVAITFTNSTKTCAFYINGASAGSSSNTGFSYSSSNPTYTLRIGHGAYSSAIYPLNGYLSNVRVSSNIRSSLTTVPTSPYSSDANTSLLCNMTNAGIPDSAMMNDLETVGNAQVSTSVKKFGTGSISFDGTGDYLKSSADTSLYTFGTGDFTVEFWMYLNNTSSAQVIFDMRPTSTNGVYPDIYFDNSGNTLNWFISSANRITSSSISATTWYHVAVARSGTSTKMFINGTQAGSTYTDTNNYLCGSNRPVVGINATDLSVSAFNGYIDDLRITKGYARYTSNFTAPTAAFPTY